MATKETKDGLGYIIQAISNIVEPKVADLRYDKTYRAKVTEKVEAGIYKVKINSREYQLEYKGDLNVGDIVRVKAPLNNFSDIYIEAEPSTGGGSGGTSNYNDLLNKPILNTNNTEAQPVNEKETIKGTIKLHKVSKTGNYNDLNNKPSLDFIPISDKGVANGVATLGTDSKVVSEQLPIASNSVLGAIKVGTNLSITNTGVLNNSISVIDNLESESTTNALSANQGKILKGYITDNDTMITTLQEDVIKVEDDITKIKSNYIPVSQKGNPNGVATLDNNALLKDTQLPIASPTRLGGIKIGENLNITADGVLSATGGGSGEKEVSISEAEPTENSIELWVDLSEDEPTPDLALDSTPIGAIIPYPNDIIPEGFLECNGQAVSRTTYDTLFDIIGTAFGSGDGSTTFNLPNIKGKTLVGLDSNDSDFNAIGKTGGEKSHTLTVEEMPSHNHAWKYKSSAQSGSSTWNSAGSDSTGSASDIIGNTGGNQPHNNLQPYVVTNFIIKAKQISMTAAKVIDNLNSTSSLDALSANQGKILNENKLNFGYSAKVSDTSISVSKLRFTVLEVSGVGDFNIKLNEYYTLIDGQIITSFIIGQANTQSNINVTSIVPAINQTNYYNYLSELQVFSDAKSATTFVHIGVFYIPND